MAKSLKNKSIVTTTIIITICTIAFKLLGFVKQAVVAYFFGTTFETDTYYVALNFVGSLSSAFIRAITISLVSIYTQCLIQKGKEASCKLISACLEILVPIVCAVLLLAYMITPQIAHMLAPAYTPEQSIVLEQYLRICYPFFLFAVVTLIWNSLMDANKDFVVSRSESFITSLTTIVCCVALYNVQAVTSLVIAQYLAYFIFGALLLIRGRRYFKFTFTKLSEVPEIKIVLYTAIPLLIGNSVGQINKIVDNSVSTGLGAGNASALSYASVLEDFVSIILVNNVVDILYVNFSEYTATGDYDRLKSTMRQALNVMVCLMVPITLITCLCSKEIVSIAYLRGNFTNDSLIMTSAALTGYALGFTAQGFRDIILRGLYSFKNTKGPMITGFFAVGTNVFFTILLSKLWGVFGVAIATTFSYLVNFAINSHMLKKHIHDYRFSQHIPTLLKQIPSSIVLIAIIFFFKHFIDSAFFVFVLSAGFGLIAYYIILKFMKIEEVDIMFEKVLAKLHLPTH